MGKSIKAPPSRFVKKTNEILEVPFLSISSSQIPLKLDERRFLGNLQVFGHIHELWKFEFGIIDKP
jgi:hypothetical protein